MSLWHIEKCNWTILLAPLGSPHGYSHGHDQGQEMWISSQDKTRQIRANGRRGFAVSPTDRVTVGSPDWNSPVKMFSSLMGDSPPCLILPKP